jgi:hypothetical protein
MGRVSRSKTALANIDHSLKSRVPKEFSFVFLGSGTKDVVMSYPWGGPPGSKTHQQMLGIPTFSHSDLPSFWPAPLTFCSGGA